MRRAITLIAAGLMIPLAMARAGTVPANDFSTLNRLSVRAAHTGDLPAAERYCRQALQAARRTAPNQAVSLALINLADIYIKQKRLSDFHRCYGELVANENELCGGPDRPSSLPALESIADRLNAVRLFDEAIPVLTTVSRINTATYGPKHANTIDSLTALAQAYFQAQKYPQSENVWRQVAGLVPAPQKPKYLLELARVLELDGRVPEAQALVHEILDTTTSSTTAALRPKDRQRVEQARLAATMMQTRLTSISNQTSDAVVCPGPTMPAPIAPMTAALATTLADESMPLAELYGRQNAFSKAEAIYRKSLPLLPHLPKGSPNRQRILSGFDLVLRRQGKDAEADKMELNEGEGNFLIPMMAGAAMVSDPQAIEPALRADAAAERLATLTGNEELVARAQLQQGAHYLLKSSYKEAIAALQKGLPSVEAKYGTGFPKVLIDPLSQLTTAFARSGQSRQAKAAYEKLLACCRRTGDPQDLAKAQALGQSLHCK